ncbi:MAG: oxygen-independent coproporphyrinogen III oxidase [Rubrivivax sp.]|nr:MAG: oxygen-independent coproporphyrinogen III oxidase [Rubrivivax sp.]
MSSTAILLTPELRPLLNKSGPRYTSYPTADRFKPDFGAADHARALAERAANAGAAPLSLYVHIPFCESICYYCACNKVVTRHHDQSDRYLKALAREVTLHARALGPRQAVSQLHFGGGTPTFLGDADLRDLLGVLREAFAFTGDAELSIEVDPRTVTPMRLQALADMGFNRLSFGVQDFDEQVQIAVHRVQPFEAVEALMDCARALPFKSINVDLIHGLPRQTPASFERTLAQVVSLRPDRIALYGYAHLPQRFKPQRRIKESELPTASQRITMQEQAIMRFTAAGYEHIGMDHFALPNDALAVAKRAGRLHRNFQGYSTRPDGDILGLGLSAIGRIGPCYTQNIKTLDAYIEAVENGSFATERGWWLSFDDEVRRAAIMAVMCQGHLDFDQIERDFGITAIDYFQLELQALRTMADGGLVEIRPRSIGVTPPGWHVVRAVAMVFDRHLSDGQTQRFSRVA